MIYVILPYHICILSTSWDVLSFFQHNSGAEKELFLPHGLTFNAEMIQPHSCQEQEEHKNMMNLIVTVGIVGIVRYKFTVSEAKWSFSVSACLRVGFLNIFQCFW